MGYIDYKKTSLRPYIETFEKFVNALIIEKQREKRGIKRKLFLFNTTIYIDFWFY